MEQEIIEKEDIGKLIAAVSKEAQIFGPVRDRNGVALVKLDPEDAIALEYTNFTVPPKLQIFPRREVVLAGNGAELGEAPCSPNKTVLFGVRPCDAMALQLLDRIFLDETYVDPYYKSRRDSTVILSLACNEPLPTCFCTSVGGSPVGGQGADVLVFDVRDVLLFEYVTEKGETFMNAYSNVFTAPTPRQEKAKTDLVSETEGKLTPVNAEGVSEKLKERFDTQIWEAIAERCLSCGVCTFLCPTCHCFGLYDEKVDSTSRRIRAQDACMFPMFTLEASGHNPRATHAERMRQRVMHKFRYTVENFGEVFCVGCGRCISHCPVNIDIRETLEQVAT